MRLKILIVLNIFLLVITFSLHGFPLKKLKKGDSIDLLKLEPVNDKGEKFKYNGKRNIIFIWRHDKRLSKKSAKYFVKVCRERDINCISMELKNASKETIKNILGDIPDNFFIAQNITLYKNWGIFTLPVTIFLTKKNKIIDAIGYEGQYVVKVERFLDFLEGKISKKEIEQLESSPVDRKISILPDMNFILKLIKNNQEEEALKKLSEIKRKINIAKLNEFEKTRYALVLIKLENYDDAEKVLDKTETNNIKSKFYRGIILYKNGKIKDSLEMFKSIEKVYPDKKAVYYYLGKIYKNKGDFKDAAEYFDKAFHYIDIGF